MWIFIQQGELERLNKASEEINKLELELDVSMTMFIVWISLKNDVSWMNTVLRQKEKLGSVPLHNPGWQSLIEIWNFSGCQSQFPTGPHRFNSPAQCFGQKAGLMCGKSSALLWCPDESKRGLY